MNQVKLKGIVNNKRGGKSAGGTQWANLLLEVEHEGRKTKVSVSAFEKPASALQAVDDGDTVAITGHLAKRKPKDEGGVWELGVIADEVSLVSDADGDIAF